MMPVYGSFLRACVSDAEPQNEASIERLVCELAERSGFPNAEIWHGQRAPERWPEPRPVAAPGEELWGWIADG